MFVFFDRIGGNNFPRSVDFISRGSNAELDEFTTDAAHGVVYHGVRLSKGMFTLIDISGGQSNKKPTGGGKGKCRPRNRFAALFRHQFVASVRPPSTVRTLFMPRSYYCH
jgi:hypothetical protein